ncbi:MAG: envelope stress response membrane protein PspC [Chitinispirillia bacterium]
MTFNKFESKNIYRSRYGMILGICRGIAEHFDLPVILIRVGVIIIAVSTGIWPVVLGYIVLAMYLKPKPVIPLSNEGENEFYNSYTASRSSALQRVKDKFDSLNKRIHRMEDIVTSKEFNWQNNFPDKPSNIRN